jgi:predicted lysophospholipase L1 biosynthesis ABC-type transport system permease subunit
MPLGPDSDLADIPGVNSVTWSRIEPNGARGTLSNTAVLGTDGTTATLEAIRDRVAWFAEATPITSLRDRYSAYGGELARIRRGVLMITLFLILVSAATTLVALVDWIMERRRSLAVLSAIGAGTSVLRRSVLLQVALPLVISTVLGLFGAITVTALLYTAVEQHVLIPFGLLVSLAAATLGIVLLVSALSLPWVRIGSRPELLREA